jgi:hypothetical protein
VNLAHELVLAEEVALEFPTYPVGQPEKHPLFFEKRVYQGSNGKVYPLPLIDKIFDVPQIRRYRAIRLENQFVRVLLLPDFGGRIHTIQDKTNELALLACRRHDFAGVAAAKACFREVLELDPSHYEATDQLRALNVLNRSVSPPLTPQEPTS